MNNKVKQFLENYYRLIIAITTVVVSQLICYGLLRAVLSPLVGQGLLITLAIWLVVIFHVINIFGAIIQDKLYDRMNRKLIESFEEFVLYRKKMENKDE